MDEVELALRVFLVKPAVACQRLAAVSTLLQHRHALKDT